MPRNGGLELDEKGVNGDASAESTWHLNRAGSRKRPFEHEWPRPALEGVRNSYRKEAYAPRGYLSIEFP